MLSLIRNNATLSKGLMMMMIVLEMTMVMMRIILVVRVKPSHQ